MRLIQDSSEKVSIVSLDSYQKFNRLKPWVYKNPVYDPNTNVISFDKAEALYELPTKMYGNTTKLAKAILMDYKETGDVLGALLVGKKGMGKSLLAETIATELIERKIPVIHVTREVSATAIEKAVELLTPCMLYLEEFEKCFTDRTDIPIFLNMFSSSTIKGLMVVIAANRIDDVAYDPLIDRPQRLRFRISYGDIDDNTVDEILSDQEVTKEQKKVYREWVNSSKPNIDSLITLVKLTNHISDPNDLVEYISILNVPELNKLRYKLKSFTILKWNYPTVTPYNYKISIKSMLEPSICSISIDGRAKFSADIDLKIEDENKQDFSVEDVLITKADSGEEAKIHYYAEFELCRDPGVISQTVSVPISKEFSNSTIPVIADGAFVEGIVKDLSYFDF